MQLIEQQGVERCVLFPSAMALSVEHYVPDTPPAYANIDSFNRWFDETWGFNRDGRIFADRAAVARDLDRWRSPSWSTSSTAARGSCCSRPAPRMAVRRATRTSTRSGRGSTKPGVTVAFHIMEHWYNEHVAPAWGHEPVAGVVAHVGVAVEQHCTASGRSRTPSRR